MASITNAVLSERQDQHHVQMMLAMARMEDQLTKMNGNVRDAKVALAVALLTGMGMAGANQVLGLVIP
jgi:hypothetical protein